MTEMMNYARDEENYGCVFSISQALRLCLDNKGKIDMDYISKLTGVENTNALVGLIFFDPESESWVTADDYLSGNIMRKLEAAKAANGNGRFAKNITALESVLPPKPEADDIYVSIGSCWIPPEIYDQFIEYMFGEKYKNYSPWLRNARKKESAIIYESITGQWVLPRKNDWYDRRDITVNITYGGHGYNALDIIERTLNHQNIVVRDALGNVSSSHTASILDKQEKLNEKFRSWIWSDPIRKEKLVDIYYKRFCCIRRRRFDGSYLTFPGMFKDIELYPYQLAAVEKMLFTKNVLLAHDVGSGKTYEMIAAAMKLRSWDRSGKNMFLVPNNIVGQWAEIFRKMYPDAKILTVEPKSFTPNLRQSVLKDIRDNDYDGIIIAYSSFDLITPLSNICALENKKKKLETACSAYSNNYASRKIPKKLRGQLDKTEKQICALRTEILDYDGICFDELGITRLFVDEAHNFKNLPISTNQQVMGINSSGSKKCSKLLEKIRCIQDNGGDIVFATGTPLTNSITDAFVLQKYLQEDELEQLGISNFDSWTSLFAHPVTDFEIDLDTKTYRQATRFSQFHNLPELTSLMSLVSDYHRVDNKTNGIPDHSGRINMLVPKTKEFIELLDEISMRLNSIRSGAVSRSKDCLLKICVDARKAALDMRLYKIGAAFIEQSKIARCAEKIANIYFRTANQKSTQLVFSDMFHSKSGFDLYDALINRLIELRVNENEIAVVHEADTDSQRSKLFKAVREGDIRVLIGSTMKLGTGVNVQDRLVALHHLDVPWRPADMTQREGRILRQGNTNDKIYIYRYIAEGSFDAYSWQLLEKKASFITDFLAGTYSQRTAEDIDDTVLDFATAKGLAADDPRVKERVEIENRLMRLKTLQRSFTEQRIMLRQQLGEIPQQEKHLRELIEMYRKDNNTYTVWCSTHPRSKRRSNKEAKARNAIREFITAAIRNNNQTLRTLMQYHGFSIVLPPVKDEKPYLLVKGVGSYRVEINADAENATNYLLRIDNVLASLNDRICKVNNQLVELESTKAKIEAELLKPNPFAKQIKDAEFKLRQLDEDLGIAI